MMLPCSLWNDSAWRALTSLVALEQVALASWTIWPLVVLAFLTAIEQVVLASKITQEQLVLASKVNWEQVVWASRVTWEQAAVASLIDSAAWHSLWQRAMLSSCMVLCLWAPMDALVVRKSSRALLAFAQSSSSSTGGVMLPVLEMAAIGEMLVGMSSREASTTLALACDEVSTVWYGPSGFWDGVMGTATGVDLLGDECLDLQLDVSSTAWDRRFLTSIVMLPSNFGGDLWGLATMMVDTLPRGGIFWSGSSIGGDRISIPKYEGFPVVRFMLLASSSGREVIMGLSCPFKPMG